MERLSQVRNLCRGSHNPDGQWCFLEAVAYVAGEPWGDAPECVCPVLGAFLRTWNDDLPTDAERNRLLLPLIPGLVNSKRGVAVEGRRSWAALDWLVCVHTPAWLEAAGLDGHARALAEATPLTGEASLAALLSTLRNARSAAEGAARRAAWSAADVVAWSAVWRAAGRAAEIAARSAADSTAGRAVEGAPQS